jgi:hypothetical protein
MQNAGGTCAAQFVFDHWSVWSEARKVHVQSGDSGDKTFVHDVKPSEGQNAFGAKHPSSPAMNPSGAVFTLHTCGDGHGVPEDQVEEPPRMLSFMQVCSALSLQRNSPGAEQWLSGSLLHALNPSRSAPAIAM